MCLRPGNSQDEGEGAPRRARAVGFRREVPQGKAQVSVLLGFTCPAMNCPKPGGKVRVEMSRVTSAGKSRRLETQVS